MKQNNITCTWSGRHGGDVEVKGATTLQQAREAAMLFFRNDEAGGCDDMGITLDDGFKSVWSYEEPQPIDWEDSFVFRSVDAYQPDTREWWEK